jgi:hypothetical protein
VTRPDRALARFLVFQRSAIDGYERSLSEEERRDYETCTCGLCDGMREMRAAVEAYEAELGLDMARVVLLQALMARWVRLEGGGAFLDLLGRQG